MQLKSSAKPNDIDGPIPDGSSPSDQIILALSPNGRAMMVRDMELIRKILLEVEARKSLEPTTVKIAGIEPLVLHRHVEMLFRGGFLEARNVVGIHDNTGVDKIFVKDLTWDGHEFIGALKNEGVWNKIKQTFSADELATFPFAVLKTIGVGLLTAYAKQKVGL
jgi:hypothetical protein